MDNLEQLQERGDGELLQDLSGEQREGHLLHHLEHIHQEEDCRGGVDLGEDSSVRGALGLHRGNSHKGEREPCQEHLHVCPQEQPDSS